MCSTIRNCLEMEHVMGQYGQDLLNGWSIKELSAHQILLLYGRIPAECEEARLLLTPLQVSKSRNLHLNNFICHLSFLSGDINKI